MHGGHMYNSYDSKAKTKFRHRHNMAYPLYGMPMGHHALLEQRVGLRTYQSFTNWRLYIGRYKQVQHSDCDPIFSQPCSSSKIIIDEFLYTLFQPTGGASPKWVVQTYGSLDIDHNRCWNVEIHNFLKELRCNPLILSHMASKGLALRSWSNELIGT